MDQAHRREFFGPPPPYCRGRGVEGRGGPGSLANMAQNRDGGNPFPDSGELDNPFQVICAGLLWPVYHAQFCGVGLLFPFVTFDPG